MGRHSSVGTATLYGLEGPGIECRWGRDFPHPSRLVLGPTQPPIQWVPRLVPGVKAAGAWRWPSTTSSAEIKERVEINLYYPSGPSWPVQGWTLPLPLHYLRLTLPTQPLRTCSVCQVPGHRWSPHLDDRACDNVQPGQGYSWMWNNGGMVISGGENRINAQKYLFQGNFFHYELYTKSYPESNSGSADRNLLIRRKLCLPQSSRVADNWPNIENDQTINQTTKESVFHCDWRKPFFIFNMQTRSLHTQISVCEACPESKSTKVLNTYKIFNLQKRHCEWIAST